VHEKEISNSQPILISPLSLPPVSCWREILKLIDGQHFRRMEKGRSENKKKKSGKVLSLA